MHNERPRPSMSDRIVVNVGDPEHEEHFHGHWLVYPDEKLSRSGEPGVDAGAYFGVARTEDGDIAVFTAHCNERWPASLSLHESLFEAGEGLTGLPQDILLAAQLKLASTAPSQMTEGAADSPTKGRDIGGAPAQAGDRSVSVLRSDWEHTASLPAGVFIIETDDPIVRIKVAVLIEEDEQTSTGECVTLFLDTQGIPVGSILHSEDGVEYEWECVPRAEGSFDLFDLIRLVDRSSTMPELLETQDLAHAIRAVGLHTNWIRGAADRFEEAARRKAERCLLLLKAEQLRRG